MVTGGNSIVVLRSASTDSHHLATEYVPQLELAKGLTSTMAEASANARGYDSTAARAYLDGARKALGELSKHLEEAERLAGRSTQLVQLKDELSAGRARFEEYQRAFEETEKAQVRAGQTRTARTRLSRRAARAGVADRVSNGDLAVEARPLSDKDALGQALVRVLQNSENAQQTDKIAAQAAVDTQSAGSASPRPPPPCARWPSRAAAGTAPARPHQRARAPREAGGRQYRPDRGQPRRSIRELLSGGRRQRREPPLAEGPSVHLDGAAGTVVCC